MKGSIVIIACLFFLSCSDQSKAPSRLLSKDKMQVVMWDLLEANSYTQRYIKLDTVKNAALENLKMQQQIFQLHKVSKDDFYKSYDYYSTQPDQMRILLDSIVAIGERNKIKMIEQQRGDKDSTQSGR
ncbi:MAG: DUF4296 domain-containing protein [Ferruginibacter sp.]|nr:DUF4296 domain-containing protein [Ferruginibacter sp.]